MDILSGRVRGGGVDSGDQFAGGECEWWSGAADVCDSGTHAGEVAKMYGSAGYHCQKPTPLDPEVTPGFPSALATSNP